MTTGPTRRVNGKLNFSEQSEFTLLADGPQVQHDGPRDACNTLKVNPTSPRREGDVNSWSRSGRTTARPRRTGPIVRDVSALGPAYASLVIAVTTAALAVYFVDAPPPPDRGYLERRHAEAPDGKEGYRQSRFRSLSVAMRSGHDLLMPRRGTLSGCDRSLRRRPEPEPTSASWSSTRSGEIVFANPVARRSTSAPGTDMRGRRGPNPRSASKRRLLGTGSEQSLDARAVHTESHRYLGLQSHCRCKLDEEAGTSGVVLYLDRPQ